ncbi:MAG TPA: hypothetical protein VJ949_02875 [Cryomorphaceae bacterium]|nr:hypothetical protein [Cryomorphaceae bacterium]
MKRVILITFAFLSLISEAQQVEYKVVTTIESIIPAGIGRSRIISEEEKLNYEDFTTERIDGKKSKQGDVKRSDAKIDNFEETKLLNFFSIAGINFQNIASNDAIISDKINKMIAQGWELAFVVSGVESDAGKDDGQGIYITRFIFKRTL